MDPEFKESVDEIRKLAARGDFTSARRRVAELGTDADEEMQQVLARQTRTLEVLESIDVVRKLLREGDTAGAGKAADSILDALTSDDYARLGVVAAALTLIGRADELARRVESGDSSHATREEIDAFVDYLGTELNQLERESVDRQLETLLNPAAQENGAGTLGDLLSNRPWTPNITPAFEGVPEHETKEASGRGISVPRGDSPVIGRILIEQEEREKFSTAPETATGGATGGEDMLGLMGRAALESWYVVAFSALIFAAFGYLAASSTPSRYESSSLVQKTRATKLRAPGTGETREYLPSLPSSTVLELVKVPMFHKRVSTTLAEGGWQLPGEDETVWNVSGDTVGRALSVKLTNTDEGTYLIEFTAVHQDPAIAQAIAGAAAEEFRRVHIEHVSKDARANLEDYGERAERIEKDLDEVYQKRLAEFAVDETESVGVSVESRADRLVRDIHQAREELEDAKIQLRAYREELDTQVNIAERLPEYESPEADARIDSRRRFLEELERELYELARKRNNFGPKHPIQDQIKEIQDDIDLVKAEIRELEKGAPEDIDERKLNPVRAIAEDRVAKARSRVSIQEDKVERLQTRVPALEEELDAMRDDYLESRVLTRHETELLSAKDRTEVVIEDLNAVLSSADRELVIVAPAGEAREVERDTLLGIAVGLVLGLVVGLGIAIGLLRRRHVRHGARTATA